MLYHAFTSIALNYNNRHDVDCAFNLNPMKGHYKHVERS